MRPILRLNAESNLPLTRAMAVTYSARATAQVTGCVSPAFVRLTTTPSGPGAVSCYAICPMLKVIRMVKRGDKLPAEFRQEWLERNRELRKAASNLVASVTADGNI